MLVNFNSINFATRNNLSNQKVNFGNTKEKTPEEILAKINSFATLEGPKRVTELNGIAVGLFARPINDIPMRDNIFKAAISYIPEKDAVGSDAKYAVEVMRLLKYLNAEPAIKQKVIGALQSRNLLANIGKAASGFETTSCNVCGMHCNMAEALGYTSAPKKIFIHRRRRENEE